MPAALTYPGVYIEEIPSGVRTITGVATSITAFIGRAQRGPVNEPVRVQSFAEFERAFGGLWVDSTLGYAVWHFFQNGGGDSLIVRVALSSAAATKAKATLAGLSLIAANAGSSGNDINVAFAKGTIDATKVTISITKVSDGSSLFSSSGEILTTAVASTLPSTIVTVDPNSSGTFSITATPIAGPLTGGAAAVVGAASATGTVGGTAGLALTAASPGAWGSKIEVAVKNLGSTAVNISNGGKFNLSVKDTITGATEEFLNLQLGQNSARFVTKVLEQGSNLVRVSGTVSASTSVDTSTAALLGGGVDGGPVTDIEVVGAESSKTGLYALNKADLFNLLCIPPVINATGVVTDLQSGTRNTAAQYCAQRRALFVADPSNTWTSHSAAISALGNHIDPSANAALFFPMLRAPDPLREGQIGEFAPCGAVAGVMARTDATRGVWKAPAGIEATLNGVSALSVKLTDGENGQLNPLGVNCLRSFPVIGRVVWGSRTRRGADQLADQWKYLPVRRLALFLEESLFRGTQWVVFEPNDEPLWAQIRLNIGAFMHNLFRQGAFQGVTPRDAYFVKCDKDTTTQNDINLGVVNIVVGFAPLKPAEFVVIKLQQIAGQIQT